MVNKIGKSVIIRSVIILTFLLMSFNHSYGSTPDFAFPEKVSKEAEADLKAALKSGEDLKAVEAMIRLGLARTQINTDSTPNLLARISALTSQVKSPAAKALLNALSAKIYAGEYSMRRWTYDQRTSTDIAGDDYTLWSRAQFLDKVSALVKSALADPAALQAVPVSDLKGIVNIETEDIKFYPTLFDFISVSALESLDSFASTGNLRVLNSALLSTPGDTTLYPGETCRPLADMLGIYDGLIRFHHNDPAPLFLQEIEVRRFVRNHKFNLASPRVTYGNQTTSPSQGDYCKEIMRLYEMNKDTEFGGLFLVEAARSYQPGEDSAGIYQMLKDYRKRFPGSMLDTDMDNQMRLLTQGRCSITLPQAVVPGMNVKVDVNSVNGRKIDVELFDVTTQARLEPNDNWVNKLSLTHPLEKKSITFDRERPFSANGEVTLSFPAYGVYVVRLTVDGTPDNGGYRVIRCSDMAVSSTVVGAARTAWVVNPDGGQPVNGAELKFFPWSRKNPAGTSVGTTDADGKLAVDITESGYLTATKGEDLSASGIYVYKVSSQSVKEQLKAELFTSLNLYRPGDEVEFALVAFTTGAEGRSIAADKVLYVELRDANRQPVDTLRVVTDSWGRATGSFTLPTSGLTGSFQLNALSNPATVGSKVFNVSDYKLPTFELKTTAVNRPASVNDGASVEGVAMTYSGFPVADAQVKASLTVQQGFWWWKTVSPVFFSTEAVTDASGVFKIDIPASVISSSPAPGGIYNCLIEVTSADGETRSLTATFNMGKPAGIIASVPSVINLDEAFTATVDARDANGASCPLEMMYTIKSQQTQANVDSGYISTGNISSVISRLQPGRYAMTFTPVDTLKADPSAPVEFVLYRPDSKVCPVDKPLWVPVSETMAVAGKDASVTVGSDCDGAWVRMIVASGNPATILQQRWLRLRKGMQSIAIPFPADSDGLTVSFSCVMNFQAEEAVVTVRPKKADDGVKIEIETFRDRVTPGEEEKITLRVRPVGDVSPQSALMLDMSSKAIDVLASNPLSMSGFVPSYPSISSNGWDFGDFQTTVSRPYTAKDTFWPVAPTLELYGLDFNGGGIRIRGVRMLSSNVMMKSAATDGEEVAEVAVADSAAPMYASAMASGSSADAGAESVEEEMASQENDTREEGNDYRPSEIPLAFFRPMLNTAEDGSLEISYTVPDANTTWIFRALAYNRQLLTASTQAEVIASKPVMVSQNAPRFLRTADSVVLASSVMNNTDSTRVINVKSEVLSASTGKQLTVGETSLTLPAKGAATVTLALDTPVGETGVIYRVKGVSGDYTDGEQSLLPVLPSEQDVVESEMFYIAPDQAQFTLDLPAAGDGDRAYLSFTENPSWQVVSALPGLREGKINSSVEASAALFSAAVADGIMRDNPEIARVLRRWIENPGDSALVSSLQKNEELKAMLLSSTPWVSAALDDTERMQRLALLFDRRQTAKVISESIDLLAKTRVDGGWAWTESYPRVSRWATEVIMEELGDLNRMGWLPSDARLNRMIKESCAYLDRETAADYRKAPDGDYWLYVIIRDRFPEVKRSTAASKVVEAQLQKALARWKDSSVAMKAVYALILNNNGYNATARQILGSLREYATSTPEKGMWWQQLDRYTSLWSYDRVGITSILLDAFNQVDPNCDDVEKIRQWLILNKTNNDWGTAVVTTQTVASILTSGKPLKVNTHGTAIHIGSTLLQPQGAEYATGAFTSQITSMLASPEMMTIDRQADYPSVGAVMTMRRLPMDSIAAVGCAEISVEKTLTVYDGTQWVASDSFKVGDRVKVELTLKVEDDLSYVVIEDMRAAGLEPVSQLSQPIFAEGLCFYRENRDAQTNIFIDFLPRGTYRLTYDLYASQVGEFSGGVAQVQSQYAPVVAAHSRGMNVTIR